MPGGFNNKMEEENWMYNKSSDNDRYAGMISLEETIELAKRKDAGDFNARQKLIVSHLWCVEKYVSYYISTIDKNIDKIELYKDLCQEGCFGLIQAVERYDWKKDVYLSTYAQGYIKKYVWKYCVEKIPHIRLPDRLYYACYKYNSFLIEFMADHNRKPTIEESAQALNISFSAMQSVLRYYSFLNIRQEGDDLFVSFDEAISNEYIKTAEELIFEIMPLEITDFECKLTERENEAIKRYLGLGGFEPQKFLEIGQSLGISDEIARRAYHSGIKKLRKAFGINEQR